MPKLKEIIANIEAEYPLKNAQSWDKNGLIIGDENAEIKRVLVAVDPVKATVEEAKNWGADLLLTHHPLYLRGTSFLNKQDPKGYLVHTLIENGIALYNAHTNADVATYGVAQAAAELLALEQVLPLEPLGDNPEIGLGRIGYLPQEMTFAQLGEKVKTVFPDCPAGILLGGDLQARVRKVAISPGSGDSFLQLAREKGAEVYICADLRHHPSSEHLEAGKPFLINLTHWASEWPWGAKVAQLLRNKYGADTIEIKVSELVTDPWTIRL